MERKYYITINGQSHAGHNGEYPVIDPSTGQAFAQCPNASLSQLDEAVTAANEAFKSWRHVSQEMRQDYLHQVANVIEENTQELAKIVVKEQGKPLSLAMMEVGGAVAWTRYTAELNVSVEVLEDTDTKRIEMHRKPLGVVGSILPWNWPLMIAVWHIMPALKSGNTVVIKPSPLTPLNTLRMVELISKVLPAGVVNIVADEQEIGPAMSAHSGIQKIVFTGSTATGQHIMRAAAENLKRLTLELGGNDGAIVLPDVNVDAIAEDIFQASFLNMGQTCAALKRLYIHEDVHDQLVTKLVDIASKQVVGAGLSEGTTFGPVQNKMQYDRVIGLINDAAERGGLLHPTADVPNNGGYFIAPTIISNVSDGMPIVDQGTVWACSAYHQI